jgi:hypothetical protein
MILCVSQGLILANINLKNRRFLKLLALAGTYFLRPKNRTILECFILDYLIILLP